MAHNASACSQLSGNGRKVTMPLMVKCCGGHGTIVRNEIGSCSPRSRIRATMIG